MPGRTADLVSMPLPSQIPVRYTEEDAGYVSVRPVVKQVFRLQELADLVVSIAGKDIARVQQIFRSGTAVYHGYRYWWDRHCRGSFGDRGAPRSLSRR